MKTEVVRVRLTHLEKLKLIDHAESMNMSMSDYIKYCCLIEPPKEAAKTKNEKAWDFALGLAKIDGIEPSDYFLELVEREKRGEINTEDIRRLLREQYNENKKSENEVKGNME